MSYYTKDTVRSWREDSDVVPCPYNPSHMIQRRKMPYHIVKCSKQHKDIHLEVCPYNASHRVPEVEMLNHLGNCPDKGKLLRLTPSEFIQPGKTGCIPHSDFVRSRLEMINLPSEEGNSEKGRFVNGIQGYGISGILSRSRISNNSSVRLSLTKFSVSESDAEMILKYTSSTPRLTHIRPLNSLPEALKCSEVGRK